MASYAVVWQVVSMQFDHAIVIFALVFDSSRLSGNGAPEDAQSGQDAEGAVNRICLLLGIRTCTQSLLELNQLTI